MAYFTKEELERFRSNTRGIKAAEPTRQQPKKKQGGLGGFLTSLIGEAGGTGGALAGAAAGTAIAPGIGTLLGAGLGGFLGGTGGQVAENIVRDDEVNINKALKEGAISGVMGAGPLRLGKAAYGGSKAALAGRNIAEGATEQVGKSLLGNVAKKAGTAGTIASSGLKPGKEIGAIENVENAARTLADLGISGTPKRQAKLITENMNRIGKEVDSILSATPIKVDGRQVGQRLKQAATDLTDERFIDLDLTNPSVQKIVERYSAKFAKARDAKGVNDIVKSLNKTATRANDKLSNPMAGALTAQENAALALKRAGDDVLEGIEEIRPLKQQMATLFNVNPDIIASSQKGVGVPFVSGVQAKAVPQAARGAVSRGSGLLQRVGQDVTENAAAPTARGIIGRTLGADVAGAALQSEQGVPDEPFFEEPTEQSMDGLSGALLESQGVADTDNPFAPKNLQANIQRIMAQGGTFKDVSEYLSIAKTIQDLTGGGGASPLNSTASGVIADTKTGLESLRQLSGDISSSSANNPLIGRIRGANPFDTGAQDLQGKIATAKQIVGKALEGGVLRKEDELKYAKLLPTMGDTDATAQNKINNLISLISGRLNEYQRGISGGSGGMDLGGLGL